MKLYKDGVSVQATKDQLPALKKAGWSKKEVKKESEERKTEGSSKSGKKITKKRKAIKKDSEE